MGTVRYVVWKNAVLFILLTQYAMLNSQYICWNVHHISIAWMLSVHVCVFACVSNNVVLLKSVFFFCRHINSYYNNAFF